MELEKLCSQTHPLVQLRESHKLRGVLTVATNLGRDVILYAVLEEESTPSIGMGGVGGLEAIDDPSSVAVGYGHSPVPRNSFLCSTERAGCSAADVRGGGAVNRGLN